jgi:shikimate kinase
VNLVLIGLRGSGKTTLGRAAAARLGREFVDLDAVTPGLLGANTVREAWAAHGEGAFRGAELRALEGVLAAGGRVVALGGGTPTAPGAEELLSKARAEGRAVVVYLRAGADELRRRLSGADNADRPALMGEDPLAEIERVLAARDGLYLSLADEVVETEGVPEREVVGRLVEALG